MKPRLSIVIPNLNSKVVDRTLDAIRDQAGGINHLEVLVVGLDEPGLVVEDPPIRHISSGRPVPPARARNIGIEQSRGELVVFTDADCIAQPSWLGNLVRRFEQPSTTVVGGAVEFDADNYWTLADNVSSFHEFLTTAPAGPRNHLPSLNLAIRRQALVEIGGFDERYPRPAGEDSDLSYRLRARGHTLFFDPSAVVKHCPARSSPAALLRHAADFGRYSVKLRPHPNGGISHLVLRHRWLLLLLSPAMAATVTARMFSQIRAEERYLSTAPAIFAAKLAWCWGAANSPTWVREQPNAASALSND